MMSTQIRRIPLLVSVLVVLLITLLLSLSLLLSSGTLRLGSAGGADPNGVTNGSMINPDGLTSNPGLDPNGVTRGSSTKPDGLACGGAIDPDGGSCQHHAGGLLATGSGMDGNGNS